MKFPFPLTYSIVMQIEFAMIITIIVQSKAIEFDESLNSTQLYDYLGSNQMPERDCKIIKGKRLIIMSCVYYRNGSDANV